MFDHKAGCLFFKIINNYLTSIRQKDRNIVISINKWKLNPCVNFNMILYIFLIYSILCRDITSFHKNNQ